MSTTHTHYYVISYDTGTNKWTWDNEAEEMQFPEGTVVNHETNEWGYALIDGEECIDFETETKLGEDLEVIIKYLNEGMDILK